MNFFKHNQEKALLEQDRASRGLTGIPSLHLPTEMLVSALESMHLPRETDSIKFT